MKVGMVSTNPSSGGGVSSYTKNLVDSLRNLDVDVTLLSDRLKKKKNRKKA
jgi:hypothetical protein